jgi:phage shock protein PspC (stress-responsive transcriptional regulator)
LSGRRGAGSNIERPWDGRLVAGVCAGLADRFDIDPTLIRLALLLLLFAHGLGLVAYAGLWLVLPPPGGGGRPLGEVVYANVTGFPGELETAVRRAGAALDRGGRGGVQAALGRRSVALALITGGAVLLLWSFGAFHWLTAPRIAGLVAIAVGTGALISLTRGGDR